MMLLARFAAILMVAAADAVAAVDGAVAVDVAAAVNIAAAVVVAVVVDVAKQNGVLSRTRNLVILSPKGLQIEAKRSSCGRLFGYT